VRDLHAWLFRIVRNAAVSHRRRAGHAGAQLVDTLTVAASPEEEAERREVIQETLETIAGLPPRQREALLRIAVQGAGQDEVAEELGVSRIAVRQLVHRARTSLRAAATALLPFPLIGWAAGASSGESLSLRIASLISGAGGAGAAATFAKAGAVAGVAATAVGGPALVEHHRPASHVAPVADVRTVRPAATRSEPTQTPTPTPTVVAVAYPSRGQYPTPAPTAPRRHRATTHSPQPAPTIEAHERSTAGQERRSGGSGAQRTTENGDGQDERDRAGDDASKPQPTGENDEAGDSPSRQSDDGQGDDGERKRAAVSATPAATPPAEEDPATGGETQHEDGGGSHGSDASD
jgi:predicted DNA-binding protein (UPF0251 family)